MKRKETGGEKAAAAGAAPARPRRRVGMTGGLLLLLLLVGLLLRVAWLGKCSYQIDELQMINDTFRASSFLQIITNEYERFHWAHRMPLLLLGIRAQLQLFGFSGHYPPEWMTRILFALVGAATLPLFYRLGRAYGDRTTGLWTLFLGTFSVFHIYHSREAYDYGLVVFMTSGMLWASLELINRWHADLTIPKRHALGYGLFSTGMLYCHLSCLLFLPFWTGLMGGVLARRAGLREMLKARRLLPWLAILAAAYVAYLPFIVRLVSAGWVRHETYEQVLSWSFVPTVLGCMGWGEGWLPLGLFALAMLLGALLFGAPRGQRWRLVLPAVVLLFAALQTRMAKIARFEVRYYSPLFPLLMIFAAAGIVGSLRALRQRLKAPREAAWHGAAALLLLAWLAPSVWWCVRLNYRHHSNYKAVANWVNANLPTNGVYAFTQLHYFRGVPAAYATPGRFAACPMPYDTEAQYRERRVAERAASFFRRLPRACLIEWAHDKPYLTPAQRAALFKREVTLGDPAFEHLVRLRTLPIGQAYANTDRAIIYHNRPEDLPVLAAERGATFYHAFGPEWEYVKDQQMNDWMSIERGGTLQIGSLGAAPAPLPLSLVAAAVPGAADVTVSDGQGRLLGQFRLPGMQIASLSVSNAVAEPGLNRLTVTYTPLAADANARLLVQDVVLPRP